MLTDLLNNLCKAYAVYANMKFGYDRRQSFPKFAMGAYPSVNLDEMGVNPTLTSPLSLYETITNCNRLLLYSWLLKAALYAHCKLICSLTRSVSFLGFSINDNTRCRV